MRGSKNGGEKEERRRRGVGKEEGGDGLGRAMGGWRGGWECM